MHRARGHCPIIRIIRFAPSPAQRERARVRAFFSHSSAYGPLTLALSHEGRGKCLATALLLLLLLLLGSWSPAAALDAPQALEAFDTPSDGGDSIGLRWRAVPADSAP